MRTEKLLTAAMLVTSGGPRRYWIGVPTTDTIPSFRPETQAAYREPRITKQRVFTSSKELLDLNIIDFHRHESWDSAQTNLDAIASWFIGRALYTVLRYDLGQAPVRSDWPEWEHVGDHAHYGRLFWNDFYWKQLGTLTFADAPDFSGTMRFRRGDRQVQFWGDIGRVSAGAFSRSQKNMRPHDLWISITGSYQQVVIEALDDIAASFHKRFEKAYVRAALALQKEQALPKPIAVPTLWD